jgi:site-specific recombinase XerD
VKGRSRHGQNLLRSNSLAGISGVERAGAVAGFEFKAHPHMLRHACGFAPANKGHDTRSLQAYLGHMNIQHAVQYTELSPDRLKDFLRG